MSYSRNNYNSHIGSNENQQRYQRIHQNSKPMSKNSHPAPCDDGVYSVPSNQKRNQSEVTFKPRSFTNHQKPVMRLRPISDCNEQCSLLQRRLSKKSQYDSKQLDFNQDIESISNEVHLTGVLFNELQMRKEVCEHCKDNFIADEKMINLRGNLWHEKCFVCAQCFQPFPDGLFFEFEGRKYCEHDFKVLLAPQCKKCDQFIMGRVIRAVGKSWHPACFKCESCHVELADIGFLRINKKSLCKPCHEKERVRLLGKNVCYKCREVVEENEYLKFKGDVFHSYHFNCHDCGMELNTAAREKDNELYCIRCYDKLGIPICAACRRPVEEKVVNAMGKYWHEEHFVCCICEKPFFGSRHMEYRGKAYCELDYFQEQGRACFFCNSFISGNELCALNKSYCQEHFSCFTCNKKLDIKTKFMELDGKPICKHCFKKFPSELVKRLKKLNG